MPPRSATKKEPAPSPQGQPSPNNTKHAHSNEHRPQDGYAAPTAEDCLDAQVLAAAAERGYRLATWCLSCGRVLSARPSLLAHTGPTCRTKAVKM